MIELTSYTSDDGRAFNIGKNNVRVTAVERVPPTLDRAEKLAIRNKERDPPPDTYRLLEYDSPSTHVMDYQLVYAVTFPSACRYATIDHVLGNHSDNSLGLLRSVSTSENTRIMHMVRAHRGG